LPKRHVGLSHGSNEKHEGQQGISHGNLQKGWE